MYQQEDLGFERMGLELHKRVQCAVRWAEPFYHKPLFECKHGVTFPLSLVSLADTSGDWSLIEEHHQKEAISGKKSTW